MPSIFERMSQFVTETYESARKSMDSSYVTSREHGLTQADLLEAINKGNIEDIKSALQRGASVNEADEHHQETPLHRAVRNKQWQAALLLLQNGADVNAVDAAGNTPFHYAAQGPGTEAQLDVLRALSEKGANINAQNRQGETPIYAAASAGSGKKVIDFMIAHRADTTLRYGRSRETLLNVALRSSEITSGETALGLIGQPGIDVNQADYTGIPPLQRAARRGDLKLAERLIEQHAQLDAVGSDHSTALMEAVKYQNTQMISLLRQKGAQIEANGLNALHFALETRPHPETPVSIAPAPSLKSAIALVQDMNPSEFFLKDKKGNTAFETAVSNGYSDVAIAMVRRMDQDMLRGSLKGSTSPLQMASQYDTDTALAIVERLSSENLGKPIVLKNDKHDKTFPHEVLPLHFALRSHNKELAFAIASRMSPADLKATEPGTGYNYFQIALSEQLPDVALTLLRKGIFDANAQSNDVSPFHQAIRTGNIAQMEDMINKNAHLNKDLVSKELNTGAYGVNTGAYGKVPLNQAIRSGNMELVEEMLNRGANPNKMDPNNNMTPLLMAISSHNIELVTLLLDHGASPHSIQAEFPLGLNNIKDIHESVPPIVQAAAVGDIAIAELLLKRGAQLDEKFTNDWKAMEGAYLSHGDAPDPIPNATPLYAAIAGKHKEFRDWLLDVKKVSVHPVNDKSKDPLNAAVMLYDIETVQKLLDRGADPAGNPYQRPFVSALELASLASKHASKMADKKLGQKYLDIAKLLYDANPEVANAVLTTETPFSARAFPTRNAGTIDLDPNGIEKKQILPLQVALASGNQEFIQRMLKDQKVLVNPPNDATAPPLNEAVKGPHANIDVVRALLERGANANGNQTARPLITALEHKQFDIARLLIEHGADVNAYDSRNVRALYAAIKAENKEFATWLITEKGADQLDAVPGSYKGQIAASSNVSPLALALVKGYDDLAELMVNKGANPNVYGREVKHKDGRPEAHSREDDTWLAESIRKGDTKRVLWLMDHKADVYMPLGWAAENAFQIALKENRIDIAAAMLKRNCFNEMALHTYAHEGNLKWVQALVEAGANVNLLNSNNETPLDIIRNAERGKPESEKSGVEKFLLSKGARSGAAGAASPASKPLSRAEAPVLPPLAMEAVQTVNAANPGVSLAATGAANGLAAIPKLINDVTRKV